MPANSKLTTVILNRVEALHQFLGIIYSISPSCSFQVRLLVNHLPEYVKGITPSLQTWTWLSIILTILFADLLDINMEPNFALNVSDETCCRCLWLTTKLLAKLLQQNETTNREEQILLRLWESWNIGFRNRDFFSDFRQEADYVWRKSATG